tara:strand:- start:476 stop:619 length:144 start_codon:yes stop_codon:yes gene_type:complete
MKAANAKPSNMPETTTDNASKEDQKALKGGRINVPERPSKDEKQSLA